jgi:hypothetical protein
VPSTFLRLVGIGRSNPRRCQTIIGATVTGTPTVKNARFRTTTGAGKMSEHSIPEMTAGELRAISRKLTDYVALHPRESDARSLAIRCGEIAALLEASSAYEALRATEQGSEGIEDRVLRIVSGAPLSRREVRVAGIFALVWFAMDGFWFISTLNHWFGL